MTTPTTGRAAALTSLALSLTLAAGQLRRSRSPDRAKEQAGSDRTA